MVQGEGSSVPPLFGLDSMAEMRVYFGSHNGLMAMLPEGSDSSIAWPTGTRFIQCRKAPSGHWLIIVSAWDKYTDDTTEPGELRDPPRQQQQHDQQRRHQQQRSAKQKTPKS